MTPDAIDYVLVLLASANVVGKLEETGPDVWEAALADLGDADGIAAAQQLIRTNRWVKIADIREEALKLRAARLEWFQYQPPATEQDPKYIERLRGQLRAIASGAVPAPTDAPMLTGGPHEDIEDYFAGVGRKVPGEEVRRPGSLGVECSRCRALVGRECKTPGGKRRKPHPERSAAAGVPGSVAPLEPGAAWAEAERRRQASRTLLSMQIPDEAS